MSASRKNPNTTRAYRERAQPQSRAKFGLLEKHKDYKLRAADHNEKKRKLRALQQKASERNADEFYFGMMSSKTDAKTGRKQQQDGGRGNTAMSDEVVRLLKTQDAGYVKTMLQRARRERERLEEEVLVVENEDGGRLQALREGSDKGGSKSDNDFDMDSGSEANAGPRHTVFVDDDVEQANFDAEDWFSTDERGLAQTYNRPRRQSEAADTTADLSPMKTKKKTLSAAAEKVAWKAERLRQKKRALMQQQRVEKLAAVKAREKSLTTAERELDLQRAKMGNSTGGVNKNGVKFKQRERKR